MSSTGAAGGSTGAAGFVLTGASVLWCSSGPGAAQRAAQSAVPSWRSRVSGILGVTCLSLLVCLPWTLRNCQRLDRCAFVSANGARHTSMGQRPMWIQFEWIEGLKARFNRCDESLDFAARKGATLAALVADIMKRRPLPVSMAFGDVHWNLFWRKPPWIIFTWELMLARRFVMCVF